MGNESLCKEYSQIRLYEPYFAVFSFEPAASAQEDDVPLTKRMAKIATPAKKPKIKEASTSKSKPDKQKDKKRKQERAEERPVKRRKPEPRGKSESQGKDEGKDVKWTTLMHSGVLFPPEYVAHGVKMTYEAKPVDLTSEQEEVGSHLCLTPLSQLHNSKHGYDTT